LPQSVQKCRAWLKHSSPSRKPLCDASVRFEGWQGDATETPLAVDEHALVVAKVSELVRFDFVLLNFVVVHVAPSSIESPRALDDAFLAEKVGGLDCIAFIGFKQLRSPTADSGKGTENSGSRTR